MDQIIGAGKFKAECLQIMDRVNKTKKPITITKRNVPIAKLVPVNGKELPLFGAMSDVLTIKGDIISPIDEEWDACH